MAGRNQLSSHQTQSRHHQLIALAEDPLLRRRTGPLPPIDDRIILLQRDLQSLLLENQRLAATHVALKQELSSTHQDLRHLVAISHKIKGERDADVREVLDRSLKVEADYRSVDAIKKEYSVVREDVERLKAETEGLGAQLGGVGAELERERAELRCLPLIRADMDGFGADIEKGRAALEVERKNRTINLQLGTEMEKKKLLAVKEIENLHAQLAEALGRKRAREAEAAAAANPSMKISGHGYGTMYVNPGIVYGGGSYPVQYPMHQGQGITHTTPQYGQGPVFCGPSNTPRENGQI